MGLGLCRPLSGRFPAFLGRKIGAGHRGRLMKGRRFSADVGGRVRAGSTTALSLRFARFSDRGGYRQAAPSSPRPRSRSARGSARPAQLPFLERSVPLTALIEAPLSRRLGD